MNPTCIDKGARCLFPTWTKKLAALPEERHGELLVFALVVLWVCGGSRIMDDGQLLTPACLPALLEQPQEASKRTRRLCATAVDTMGREIMVKGQVSMMARWREGGEQFF